MWIMRLQHRQNFKLLKKLLLMHKVVHTWYFQFFSCNLTRCSPSMPWEMPSFNRQYMTNNLFPALHTPAQQSYHVPFPHEVVHMLHTQITAVATTQGQCLFLHPFQTCSFCLRVATKQRWHLIVAIWYIGDIHTVNST